MSQVQKERPQEKKPRPQENHGPTLDANIDIGDADDILKQLEEIENPLMWEDTSCCVTRTVAQLRNSFATSSKKKSVR
jgi:hypothetical protein